MPTQKPIRYKDAGVNIDEADRAVSYIKVAAKKTFTRAVLADIGSFGAMYKLSGYKRPVLISSADGVGTKIKVAFQTGRHDTVGQDLVNHCVNDIAVQGAMPLFFLDYFAVGKLNAEVAGQIATGLGKACEENGCALIGGETAEMPGLYQPGEYDLAGFIVGCVEQSKLLTGATIQPGDVLLGLPSTGLHTNGYSLARKLLFDVAGYTPKTFLPELDGTIADELLKVHRSYLKPIQKLMKVGLLAGAAHITGGGITDNTPRILPKGLAVEIKLGSWPILPVFELMRRIGNIPDDDYRRTFNLGIGMILVIPQKKLLKAERALKSLKQPFHQIGKVIKQPRGKGRVIYK
ncbi:MAG: phosphoribosylformylglycinamidine cyclo-ligase [Bryobacterales bacterium]|nr:phosphoribosylformylglycinamidine cyclo-ligase [Bryobacterales bacterium]